MKTLQQLSKEYDDYMKKLQAVADSHGEVTINAEDLAMLKKLTADIFSASYSDGYSKASDEAHWGSDYLG